MCLDEAEQKDNWFKKSWIGAGVISLRVLGHVRGPGLHATVVTYWRPMESLEEIKIEYAFSKDGFGYH